MFIHRLSWCLIIVLLAIGEVEAQASYQFVYAYQPQAGQFHIASIDPSTRQVTLQTVEVDTTAGLSNAAAHSTTGWLTFLLRSGQNEVLEVVNTRTLERRSAAVNAYPPEATTNLLDEPQDFLWSPDGQFIAFNVWDRQGGANDTILYSMETGTSENLTDNAASSSQLAWSSDSTRLALASIDCEQSCMATLDIYDLPTMQVMLSYPLPPDVVGGSSLTLGAVCRLSWSPDNRYISFMANCDSSFTGTYKEIYLLTLESGELQQITDYTYRQNVVEQNGFVYAEYRTLWLNNDDLLISAIYGLAGSRHTETLVYSPSSGVTASLAPNFLQTWAIDPVSHQLAYQILESDPQVYASAIAPSSIHLTSLDTLTQHTFSESAAIEAGCLMDWSPDGSMIAYSLPINLNNCESGTASFGIVQIGAEQSSDDAVYSPPSDALFVLPLGWIAR